MQRNRQEEVLGNRCGQNLLPSKSNRDGDEDKDLQLYLLLTIVSCTFLSTHDAKSATDAKRSERSTADQIEKQLKQDCKSLNQTN